MSRSADLDIDRKMREALDSLGVRLAYLFGSRATGSARPDSDLDVAVLADNPISLEMEARLATLFSDASDVVDVDVVDLRAAPLPLRGRVAQEGRVLFCSDEVERVRFEAQTRTRYLDFLPTLRMHDRAFAENVVARGL